MSFSTHNSKNVEESAGSPHHGEDPQARALITFFRKFMSKWGGAGVTTTVCGSPRKLPFICSPATKQKSPQQDAEGCLEVGDYDYERLELT